MRYFIIIGLLFSLLSCNLDNCSSKLNFKLDYHLFDDIKVKNRSYCDLVNDSFSGDKSAIKDLSTLQLYDFASYQHGGVILQLIEKMGEQDYVESLVGLNQEEKVILKNSLKAGLEFTESINLKGKNLEELFPIVDKLISS